MIDDPHSSSDHATYAEYLDFASNVGIPEQNRLTYDQFIGNVENTQENIEKVKLGFLIPGRINPRDVVSGYNDVMDLVDTGLTIAEGIGYATSRARQRLRAVVDRVSNLGGGQGNFIEVLTESGDPGPPRVPPGGGGGRRFNHFDLNSLNFNPDPIEARLNTQIPHNVYAPYYIEADSTHAPLHISCNLITVPDSTAGKLYTFLDQVMTLVFQNASQANVGFNLDVTNTFTTAKIREYVNAVAYALQIEYFYTSIISYCDYPHNHNAGMIALRSAMTADELDDIYQLHRTLEGTPIPPNLNNLIFYLSQNFAESSLPGSAILKISPVAFTTTTSASFTALTSGKIAQAIAGLNSVRPFTALLSKVVPEWLKVDVMAVPSIPVHDVQFNTLFANLPGVGSDTTGTVRYPGTSAQANSIVYNSFANDLDGAIFGLASAWLSGSSVWVPSLMNPETVLSTYSTTKVTNRISYWTSGSTTAFFPAETSHVLCYMRNETYIIGVHGTTTTVSVSTSCQRYDTEQVLGVSGNSIRETAYRLLEWMLSLDSLVMGTGYDKRNPINVINNKYITNNPAAAKRITHSKGKSGNSNRKKGKGNNKDKSKDID